MTIADDVAALIADDLAEGGGTATGTYTPISGTTLADITAIERNMLLNDGSGRATMDVLIEKSVLTEGPQTGAKWDNGDGRAWVVYAFDDVLPLMTQLSVEAHVGTGSQT